MLLILGCIYTGLASCARGIVNKLGESMACHMCWSYRHHHGRHEISTDIQFRVVSLSLSGEELASVQALSSLRVLTQDPVSSVDSEVAGSGSRILLVGLRESACKDVSCWLIDDGGVLGILMPTIQHKLSNLWALEEPRQDMSTIC